MAWLPGDAEYLEEGPLDEEVAHCPHRDRSHQEEGAEQLRGEAQLCLLYTSDAADE